MDKIKEIYRRMRNTPLYIKEDGSVTSALFLDSQGVSVDIDAGREIDDIIADEERLHILYHPNMSEDEMKEKEQALKAIVSVTKSDCDEKDVLLELDPILGENEYHAILRKDVDTIVLTKGQRRHLAQKCKYVKKYF